MRSFGVRSEEILTDPLSWTQPLTVMKGALLVPLSTMARRPSGSIERPPLTMDVAFIALFKERVPRLTAGDEERGKMTTGRIRMIQKEG